MAAKFCFAVFACVAMASCGLPRSAGFTTEVLAASNANSAAEGQELVYDFAVYQVNRATLPMLQKWAATVSDPVPLPWPSTFAQSASFVIGDGDQVQLTIWDAEEDSIFGAGGVTALPATQVDTRGRIFVPFIGEIRVSGMSTMTARQRIEEELVRTIPSAQVQVVVEPGRENTANLADGFGAPGLYPLPHRNFTILDLFSQAGGPNPEIVSPQIRLVRGGQTYGIPFARLLKEPELNTTVRGGDRLYVEDDARQFIAFGATGSQSLVDFPDEQLSALEAIAMIGGVNPNSGNPENILIMRDYAPDAVANGVSGPPRERVVFAIDLTSADGVFSAGKFMLEDGDVIYGPESALGPALTILNLGTSLTAQVRQVRQIIN